MLDNPWHYFHSIGVNLGITFTNLYLMILKKYLKFMRGQLQESVKDLTHIFIDIKSQSYFFQKSENEIFSDQTKTN